MRLWARRATTSRHRRLARRRDLGPYSFGTAAACCDVRRYRAPRCNVRKPGGQSCCACAIRIFDARVSPGGQEEFNRRKMARENGLMQRSVTVPELCIDVRPAFEEPYDLRGRLLQHGLVKRCVSQNIRRVCVRPSGNCAAHFAKIAILESYEHPLRCPEGAARHCRFIRRVTPPVRGQQRARARVVRDVHGGKTARQSCIDIRASCNQQTHVLLPRLVTRSYSVECSRAVERASRGPQARIRVGAGRCKQRREHAAAAASSGACEQLRSVVRTRRKQDFERLDVISSNSLMGGARPRGR